MRPQWTWMPGTVARRLLLLFVGCALLPIAVLAAIAWRQVTSDLYEQSQRRLHLASKQTALALLARLQALDGELETLGDLAHGDLGELRRAALRLDHRFDTLSLLPPAGPPIALLGGQSPPRELSRAARSRLARGRTLLWTHKDAEGRVFVELARSVETQPPALLAGRANFTHLLEFALEDTLPPLAEFCILNRAREPIHCSLPGPPSLPPRLEAEIARSASGRFEWSHAGSDYLGRYWSVLLEPMFDAGSWTVILAEPRDHVLAPVADFQKTFSMAVLACLFVVSLFSLNRIRKRLEPLEALREGTRRVAQRRFDVELRVDSGDEFQVVAESFNAMARRLKDQFDRLATMIEIDRTILSATELSGIAEGLVTRVRDLYPCEAVLVLVSPPDRHEALLVFSSARADADVEVSEREGFSPGEARRLGAAPERSEIDLSEGCPGFLEPLRSLGLRSALVLPLFVKSQLCGVIACARRESGTSDPEAQTFARQLADQTAIALASIYTHEANRVLAYYDALTALPNRLLFWERLEQALVQARRQPQEVAVCLFDLDGFKRVNDTLGHDLGDQLLRQVAERIGRKLRTGSLARIGGDEFSILIRDVASLEDPARVAEQVLRTLSKPFRLESQEVLVTASIGIAVYPSDGDSLDTLLRSADNAMYHAKEEGGNCYRFFTPSMHERVRTRLRIEGDLRLGLEREELRLAYSPIVDVESREMVAAEALVRWQHPHRGLIQPGEFISIAEETGQIRALSRWVLKAACRQNRAWQLAGLRHLAVAVNVSSRHFEGGSVIAAVREALAESDLAPHYLGLELTESSLMNVDESTRSTLRSLRDFGVQLSIDDFGTGYSSLSYLKHFPLDHLKIDRSFVSDVATNPDDAAIVRAVIAMAHGLGLQVVAEGVETEAQLAFLREHGCDLAQGYLFSEPLFADAFEKLLARSDPP